MMDFTGIGSVADAAKTIVNKFLPDKMSDGERAQAELQLQELLADRETALIDAKKSVMVAELSQDDNFTKRGRPTLIYSGLVFTLLNHVLIPFCAWLFNAWTGQNITPPNMALPTEFWVAWGGAVTVYVIGRSNEKSGVQVGGVIGKAYNMIAGK